MKNPQSLRALASELGVSASYLSQVKHGKRPPSERLLNMLGDSERGLLSRQSGRACHCRKRPADCSLPIGNCRGRGSNPHRPQGLTDFKSVASANSATSALAHSTYLAATLPMSMGSGCTSAPLYYDLSRQ